MATNSGNYHDSSQYPMLFVENVKAVITRIKDETNWSRSEATSIDSNKLWSDMNALADITMAEVNKISLLYTKSPKPSCKDAEKIFEKLTSTLFAVLSTLYKIHNASVGTHLTRHWHTSILGMIAALQHYGQSIAASYEDRIVKETANVWEICERIKAAPTSCQQCLQLQLKETYQLVADALDELNEVKEGSSEADGSHPDVPLDGEMPLLISGIGLVKAAKYLHIKTMKAIETLPNPTTDSLTTAFIADCDNLADVISSSSELVDDFSASLYPPIDREEVIANVTPLVNHLNTLLQIFRSSQLCRDTENSWLTVIENGISHNNDKLLQQLL